MTKYFVKNYSKTEKIPETRIFKIFEIPNENIQIPSFSRQLDNCFSKKGEKFWEYPKIFGKKETKIIINV